MTSVDAGDDLRFRPAPFLSSVMQIEPAWIDYNGHLNMAYYNVMFDRAIDELWLQLGIGPGYMKERHGSTFTAECHVRYLREIHLGDPVQVSILLVAADEKRLHTFEELRHATEGWLSATSENMTIHIDMTARKTAPFPSDIRARIEALANAHAAIARPEGIGRKIAMPAEIAFRSDPGAPARQADHGRDQEQHDRDEEDGLGDFDGRAGDAAEAQNTRDQRNNQKRNNPAQHDKTSGLNFPFRYQRDPWHRASAAETIRPGNKSSALFRTGKWRKMAPVKGTKSPLKGETAAARATG